MDQVSEFVSRMMQHPASTPTLVLLGALLLALVAHVLVGKVLARLARKTKSEVDDQILLAVRRPIVWSIVLAAVAWVVADSPLEEPTRFFLTGITQTMASLIWALAAMRIGSVLLDALSRQVDRVPWIQPKTLPLLQIVLKVLVAGGLLYFTCIAWQIPLTSWLASAGIVGIAVGFAAKDTLANLFSGIFILTDTPYKIGDFVNLDSGVRGMVVDVGIRSTRILTRDDIEITVPNAVIGNAQIVNETGGRHDKMRVRVKIGVAYGSDVDQVREVLMSSVEGIQHVVHDPAPRVRFREFGDSGLLFELLAWIEKPVFRGRVLDALNTSVYKSLNEAGIEIPYMKHDVYIKQMGPDS